MRTKGELTLDDSNGKFLGDMLAEMENFSSYCYKEHIRPKLIALTLVLPEVSKSEQIGLDGMDGMDRDVDLSPRPFGHPGS